MRDFLQNWNEGFTSLSFLFSEAKDGNQEGMGQEAKAGWGLRGGHRPAALVRGLRVSVELKSQLYSSLSKADSVIFLWQNSGWSK